MATKRKTKNLPPRICVVCGKQCDPKAGVVMFDLVEPGNTFRHYECDKEYHARRKT